MPGRHRKPTKTGLRLTQAGALTIMTTAPLAIVGSAMAALATASTATHDNESPTPNKYDKDKYDRNWSGVCRRA